MLLYLGPAVTGFKSLLHKMGGEHLDRSIADGGIPIVYDDVAAIQRYLCAVMHDNAVFHRVARKYCLTGGIYIRYNEGAAVIYLVLKGGIPDGSNIRVGLIVIAFQIKLFLCGDIDTVFVALAVEKVPCQSEEVCPSSGCNLRIPR